MKTVNTIMGTFNQKQFNELRQAYMKADGTKQETFTHDGKEYDVKFAKYLLEFLLPHFQTEQK